MKSNHSCGVSCACGRAEPAPCALQAEVPLPAGVSGKVELAAKSVDTSYNSQVDAPWHALCAGLLPQPMPCAVTHAPGLLHCFASVVALCCCAAGLPSGCVESAGSGEQRMAQSEHHCWLRHQGARECGVCAARLLLSRLGVRPVRRMGHWLQKTVQGQASCASKRPMQAALRGAFGSQRSGDGWRAKEAWDKTRSP